MSRRIILFTSLPRVGGHSTLTYGLCRMLKPHFDDIEVWCKTMPEHGHSSAVAAKIEELGCKVLLVSDEQGKIKWPVLLSAVANAWKNRPSVFFTLAMRHLSALLAVLVSAKNSIYYHITHDLNEGTIKRLNLYAKVFRKMVFICPATYDDFPGASTNPQFTWVPQSSEIPVREPEKLAGEREALLAGTNPPIRFGLIGRLTEDKGSAAMIDFVDKTKVACELHVAGVGPFADAFKERASRTGPATVKFLGAFDPADREAFLRKFFAGIDLLLVPSQDAWETLSMATLESLQHGVPAMLCSTGGLVSFIHPQLGPAPEDVVRLVDPKEYAGVLEKLAVLPRRSQAEAVQQCREYYERFFNDPAVLQKWLNVLKG
jgi:glycosyltransferase involved in cell wall biosynthesis